MFTRLNALKFTQLKFLKVHVPFLPLLYLSTTATQWSHTSFLSSCSLKISYRFSFLSSSSVGCRAGDYELPPATTILCQFRQLARANHVVCVSQKMLNVSEKQGSLPFYSFNLLQRIDLPHIRTSVHIGHNSKVLSQGNWNGAEGRLGCSVVSLHHEAKQPLVKRICSKTTVSGGVTDPRVTVNHVIAAYYPIFFVVFHNYILFMTSWEQHFYIIIRESWHCVTDERRFFL